LSSTKEKILLVSGCSHAGGYEIDYSMDSEYNRYHSFGGQLTHPDRIFSDRKLINISAGSVSNSYILRNTLLWFQQCYDPDLHDVFCLIAWSDSARWELPLAQGQDIQCNNPHLPWFSPKHNDYLAVNLGWIHNNRPEFPELDQEAMQQTYHNLINEFPEQMEILSFNYALQLQWFFQSKGIEYLMCDTLHNFDKDSIWISAEMLDASRYMNLGLPLSSFYLYYKELYVNVSREFGHLGRDAHEHYSQKLEEFILENQ